MSPAPRTSPRDAPTTRNGVGIGLNTCAPVPSRIAVARDVVHLTLDRVQWRSSVPMHTDVPKEMDTGTAIAYLARNGYPVTDDRFRYRPAP